jgi:hypothetical protein
MSRAGGNAVEQGLAAVAAGLTDDEMAHARALTENIVPVMPDLGPEGERQILLSCQANIRVIAQLLQQPTGASPSTLNNAAPPPPPAETMRYLDMLMSRSLDVESLLDGYRVGHAALWRCCARVAFERIADPGLLRLVLEEASEIVFGFINAALRRVREQYQTERLSHLRWPAARKLAAIHDLLQLATNPDPAELTGVLGYDVARVHLGFIVRSEANTNGNSPAAVAERIAGLFTESGRALVLPSSDAGAWMWLTCSGLDDARQQSIRQLVAQADATVGIGELARGVAGFRETHQQAQEALDTALRIDQPLARYGDVALISALTAHPDRAMRMMRWWLGSLAEDNPAAERLRETLRVLLETNLNQRETARRMHIHPHTVSYRLKRSEELLARPLADHALELRAALLIHETLYPANPSLDSAGQAGVSGRPRT